MSSLATKLLECVEQLPEATAREVLDFAQFLLQREAAREDADLIAAQQPSMADWDNAEDDVWNNAPGV
jgi:hypothetical protein